MNYLWAVWSYDPRPNNKHFFLNLYMPVLFFKSKKFHSSALLYRSFYWTLNHLIDDLLRYIITIESEIKIKKWLLFETPMRIYTNALST